MFLWACLELYLQSYVIFERLQHERVDNLNNLKLTYLAGVMRGMDEMKNDNR